MYRDCHLPLYPMAAEKYLVDRDRPWPLVRTEGNCCIRGGSVLRWGAGVLLLVSISPDLPRRLIRSELYSVTVVATLVLVDTSQSRQERLGLDELIEFFFSVGDARGKDVLGAAAAEEGSGKVDPVFEGLELGIARQDGVIGDFKVAICAVDKRRYCFRPP